MHKGKKNHSMDLLWQNMKFSFIHSTFVMKNKTFFILGYAFVQFTNPFDARNACHGEDGAYLLLIATELLIFFLKTKTLKVVKKQI